MVGDAVVVLDVVLDAIVVVLVEAGVADAVGATVDDSASGAMNDCESATGAAHAPTSSDSSTKGAVAARCRTLQP